MLQVGKEQLAQRMYETWCRSAKRSRVWGPGNRMIWPWEALPQDHRQCWLDTAEAAAKMLTDAMAAA